MLQTGSLAGAAHLLNPNTGILSRAQREQKSRVERQGKSHVDYHAVSDSANHESVALRSFSRDSMLKVFKLEVTEKLPQG